MRNLVSRRLLSAALLASGAVIAVSYGFAGYLVYRRYQPLHPPARLPARGTRDWIAAGDAQLRSRNVEQALVAYREALSAHPDSLAAQLGVAHAEAAAGREDVAAREFERALALDTANEPALLALARIHSHTPATWAAAEARYRQYLKLAPKDAPVQLELARVAAWQGKADEAAALFARPDVTPLLTNKDRRDYAFALVKLGRSHQAEPILRALMAEAPGDQQLPLQLAGIYAGRKDWDNALPLYHALLAKRPGDPQLNYAYGSGLLACRRYRDAVPPLERARNAMPGNAEAGLACARAWKGAGDKKKSLREYERVLPRYSRNAAVVREYADALLENRDYKKSARYYAASYDLGLRDDRMLLGLAGAYAGQGKYKDALPYLEELYRRQPTPRVTFELARAMAKTGRNDRAKQLLRQVQASGAR
jgi:predicted Zn-dependent protease